MKKLKDQYAKKIKILGGQAQKSKKYGGNLDRIEGQIQGIKWALSKVYKVDEEIADIGMMLETTLGYLSTPQVSDADAKKAEHHLEVAQRMLFRLIRDDNETENN